MKIKPADSTEWYKVNGDYTLRLEYSELNEDSIVVDVGARHGDWAVPIRDKYNCNVICFEIIQSFVDELKNLNFPVYKVAILDNNSIETFGVDDNEASVYHSDNTFEVETIDTLKLFDIINSPTIDLLKLNIEGAEYRVIQNLIDNNLLHKIKNIQVQFHKIENFENIYDQLYDILSETHTLTWKYPFIWESWKLK